MNICVKRNRIILMFLVYYISVVIPTMGKIVVKELPDVLSEKESIVWCKFQPNGYDCKKNGAYSLDFYYDTKMQDCRLFNFGTCAKIQNQFRTLKECRDACLVPGFEEINGVVTAKTSCQFQPDFGLCDDYYPQFYFDMTTRTCKGFSYSGCGGNLNRFETAQACITTCNMLLEARSSEIV